MKRKKTKHPKPVKVGNSTVRIYSYPIEREGTKYTEYKVVDCRENGRRKFHSFLSLEDAQNKAEEIAVATNTGQIDALTLTNQDKAVYTRAISLLKPTGIPLEVAIADVVECYGKLGGRSLREAVDYFVTKCPGVLPKKTVDEVFAEMIEAKKGDGLSDAYIRDLEHRIGRFAETHKRQIANVTEGEINAWLRGLKCGGRARNNYRLALGTLYKFAESCGYLPKDHVDFERIPRAKEQQTEIGIFTPQEITKLLKAATLNPNELKPGFNIRYATGQGLLPLIVLGAFAGLRTAEIMRQKWSDVILERGFIRVTAVKGNTAQKRLVPISDNLRKWLESFDRTAETCCDYGRVEDAINRLAKRAGVQWRHNALRHSYISYRVAMTQNIPQVALEAGNSVEKINSNYRELVWPEDAEKWFSIVPDPKTLAKAA
jgi:site-specific recombinase XerD